MDSLQFMGGTESIDISKWREWIPTVKHRPRPISYDLLPIYRLLPPKSDKRYALEQATLYFRTQADLNERAYVTKLQEIPRPPASRCHKPITKRSLEWNPRQAHHQTMKRSASPFEFSAEARAALCPFVGTEGMRCLGDQHLVTSGRQASLSSRKLPVGVGISVDRSTGRLLAPAAQLTYTPDSSQTWTDSHSGTVFHLSNEAVLRPPNEETAAYNVHGIRIFHNASQVDAAWRQTFADGSLRGGELARAPDMLDYYDK
jgi:hypothetical protein